MVKKILMIAGDYSEDYEVMVPFQALQIQGYQVDVVSPGKKKGDTIQTAVHGFREKEQTYYEILGHQFSLNYSFDEVKIESYDGLYLPGGRSPEYLRYNEKVMDMVKYFIKENKPICSVCHASMILAATGMIKDRKLSGFYSTKIDVESAGGKFTPGDAVVDGNIVTGETYLSHVPMIIEFIKLLK